MELHDFAEDAPERDLKSKTPVKPRKSETEDCEASEVDDREEKQFAVTRSFLVKEWMRSLTQDRISQRSNKLLAMQHQERLWRQLNCDFFEKTRDDIGRHIRVMMNSSLAMR